MRMLMATGAAAALLGVMATAGVSQAAPAAVSNSVAGGAIVRTSMGAFPISSVVAVPAGATTYYVSGTPTPPPAAGAPWGDTKAQTAATLKRIGETLAAQGLSFGDVVMMRVFLVGDPALGGKMDFAGMMAAYSQVFGTPEQPNKPARTTVQIAALAAAGPLVEIEVQAAKLP